MTNETNLLTESLDRLFTEHVTRAAIRRIESDGAWPSAMWDAVEAFGLFDIFAGGSDDPWRDWGRVLIACGRHGVPAPVAERLTLRALLPDLTDARTMLALEGGNQARAWKDVIWGRHAHIVIALAPDGVLWQASVKGAELRLGQAIAREPRDEWALAEAPQMVARPSPRPRAILSLMRSGQMTGAIARVLEMSIAYAKERVQFGKPIGSFQAIQQALAVLATQSAAASCAFAGAVETLAKGAPDAALARDAAIAKLRINEAAGFAARIAHQVHGAIGFTDEHALHDLTRRLWTWRAEFGGDAELALWLGQDACRTGADALWPSLTDEA